MTIEEVATFDVRACGPDSDLAGAAQIMWDCDCGVVPVIDEDRRVVGMLTDRDICIAAATRGARPSEIQVRDVMTRDVAACQAGDDVRTVLQSMRNHRVRRLPVLDGDGRLAGIVSMNDLVKYAACRAGAAVPGGAFLETMRAICEHTGQQVSV